MPHARIISTGGYQPGEPITNADIERLAGPLPDDIMAGISIQRRFWMIDPETGEHRENNSDMAYKATKEALDNAYHFDFHKFHQDASPATIASFDRIRHFTTEAILPPVVEKLMRRIVVLEKQHAQLVDLLDDLLEMLSEEEAAPAKVARG